MFRFSIFFCFLAVVLAPQIASASICPVESDAAYKAAIEENVAYAVKKGHNEAEWRAKIRTDVGKQQEFRQEINSAESGFLELVAPLTLNERAEARAGIDSIVVTTEKMETVEFEKAYRALFLCVLVRAPAPAQLLESKAAIANIPSGGPSMMASEKPSGAAEPTRATDDKEPVAVAKNGCVTMHEKENSNGFWMVQNDCGYKVSGYFCYIGDEIFGCDAQILGSFGPVDDTADTRVSGPGSKLVATGQAIEWRVSYCDYDASIAGRCKSERPTP